MDPLSDVLEVVRLAGAVFFTTEFTAPWSVESPPPERLGPLLMPGAECFAFFHVLAEGHCWVTLDDETPAIELSAGDVMVFPTGEPHVLASEVGNPPTGMGAVLPAPPWEEMPLPRLVHGGGGAATRFVCGFLHCDQQFNPLFESLPRLLVVRTGEGRTAVEAAGGRSLPAVDMRSSAGTWLETTVRYMIAEALAAEPGRAGILPRLTELLFVEVVRHYMQQLPPDETGWLAALRDPHVGKALHRLHSDPAHNWTVDELARQSGLSRSALAERFHALVGEPPRRYLSRWRIQRAMQLLANRDDNLASVAAAVGYESEEAFNRAFKRHMGQPPGTWRARLTR